MTQIEKLRIYFILPTDETVQEKYPPDMNLGFQTVSKYGGYAKWMKPSDCILHEPEEKDVFVFDKFEGPCFEALRANSSKYLVLGARCLLTCFTNGRCIPSNPHPIFCEGMRDLYVTSSGFDQATKKRIQEKVQFMAGHYDNALRSIITHLVAHNNLSSKAIHSYKGNVKIMKLSWVEDVWQQNLEGHVHATDEIFNKHLSPLFHNLNITTSGLPKREKEALKEMIEAHGGRFMGNLEERMTNVVLLRKPEGEKFKFAKAWGINCLRPDWVFECVKAKAIVPFKSYSVDWNKPKASTPNKENFANFSADFTANLSVINNADSNKLITAVDETAATPRLRSDFQMPRMNNNQSKMKTAKSSQLNVINNFLLKNLKGAGLFLDGLNIFLDGFNPEEMEWLKKVLNKGGATRLNELSESVTHIISGKKDDPNLERLAKYGAYVLSLDWLVESIKHNCKASEEKFLLVKAANRAEPPSPMSKVGAQLLSQEGKIPQFNMEDKNDDKLAQVDDLLCRYNASQPGESLDRPDANPPVTGKSDANPPTMAKSDANPSTTLNCSKKEFFAGLTFFLSNDLSDDEAKYLEDLITNRKGRILGKRHLGVADYAIVPVLGASLTEVTAKDVVTIYFIKDCCVENCVLAPQYYHQPVAFVKNAAPLKNCVISVSNYVESEREFVEMMIEALGGVAQPVLARKAKQGSLKSTHLVCAEAQGAKYEGAMRWGVPVVHHDWLLKCAALGTRVSEKPYLMGESKLPSCETTLPSTTGAGVEKTAAGTEKTAVGMEKTLQEHAPIRPEPPAQDKTPVHAVIARLKLTETPKNGSPDPNRTVTPTSPYGAFYGKGSPTPETRKRIWKWMNQGSDLPVDPPPRHIDNEEDSTPETSLISRHLEMLKRKPEELPSDSPVGLPPKRLIMGDSGKDEKKDTEELNSPFVLHKMKCLEKNSNGKEVKSPPFKPPETLPKKPIPVVAESQPHSEVGWEVPFLEHVINLP